MIEMWSQLQKHKNRGNIFRPQLTPPITHHTGTNILPWVWGVSLITKIDFYIIICINLWGKQRFWNKCAPNSSSRTQKKRPRPLPRATPRTRLRPMIVVSFTLPDGVSANFRRTCLPVAWIGRRIIFVDQIKTFWTISVALGRSWFGKRILPASSWNR